MGQSGPLILIVDDEPQIRKLLRLTLQAHQFETLEAASGEEALLLAAMNHPDLLVLDLGLPDMSGMDVMRRVREWSQVPIIVLTVKDREVDKVEALNGGADDYVTKPFGMGELVARIRVALRHVVKTQEDPVLTFGELCIDISHRSVELRGKTINLTPTEYELLKVLALNAGRVMTHKQLLQQVWGGLQYDSDTQYLRVYVGHLRKKIETDPTRPKWIVTEPGIGYRLVISD